MPESRNPIGWPVKALAACLGLLLILVAVASIGSPDGEIARFWWLPAIFGVLFLLPLYSSAARPAEVPSLRARAGAVRRLERWISGLSLAGAFALRAAYRAFSPESVPITEHPVFGPLMIIFSVLFFIGAFAQFFHAYLDSKAQAAV